MAIFTTINTKNIEASVEQIIEHIKANEQNVVYLLEVTNKIIIEKLDIYNRVNSIDPQHGVVKIDGEIIASNGDSCTKEIYKLRQVIKTDYVENSRHGQIMFVHEKVDNDSLCANALLGLILEYGFEQMLSVVNGIEERINKVDAMDSFVQPSEWNKDFQNKPFEIGWQHVMGAAAADYKKPLLNRVNFAEAWLVEGEFPDNQYEQDLLTEKQKLDEVKISIINNVVVAQGEARGITGIIYRSAPYGIAFNPNMNINGVVAPKYTVCQFQKGYVDLAAFFAAMNSRYPEASGTWGGNMQTGTVGGSPHGTELTPHQVAEVFAEFVVQPYTIQ